MIATGGLLRINARRQDSLRSKTHKPHIHKKKSKKKRSEVVVVKGKLQLFSLSGLVAVIGIIVLIVGGVMAALGYWPRDGLFFSTRPQDMTGLASVSLPSKGQGEHKREQLGGGVGEGEGLNQTEGINGTNPQGFLEVFLHRYLYSDRLKVFGPLIMGIGIFLFICANAVLHENRDQRTKVINLRDIYSTVIDLNRLKRPTTSSSSVKPLNGLVNYVQSKSLEANTQAYPSSLLSRREGAELLSMQLPGPSGGGEAAVFSIYSPAPCSSHRLSLPPSLSYPPPPQSSTVPLRHPHFPYPCRRHSVRAGSSQGWDGSAAEVNRQENVSPPPVILPLLPPPISIPSSSSSVSLFHLSVSSLSHLLSWPSSMLTPPCRRRSLPAGSSKLLHESVEWMEAATSPYVTSHRQRMILLRQNNQSEPD